LSQSAYSLSDNDAISRELNLFILAIDSFSGVLVVWWCLPLFIEKLEINTIVPN